MTTNGWNIAGKTCLVTGASSGIGKVTARELARLGANVIIVCRNLGRGEAAREEIRKTSGNASVELMTCDFASQRQIRELAQEFLSKHRRLDVLINNAGLMMNKPVRTEDGLEMTFAVNHLGYFLLTHLLLAVIKTSAPARIINVASLAHRTGMIHFDDLQSENAFSGMRAYRQSKLANIMFTYELARRLDGTGVTVNCLHPGIIGTNIARHMPKLIDVALKLIFTSPEKGAATSLYLATAPELEKITGTYFDDKKPVRSSEASYHVGHTQKLWEVSAQLTGLQP